MKTFEDLVIEINKGIEEFSTIFTKEFGNKSNKINELFDQIKKDIIQNDKDDAGQNIITPNDNFFSKFIVDNKMVIKLVLPGFDKQNIKVTKNFVRYMINAINGEVKNKVNTSFLIDDKFNVLIVTEYKNGVLSFVFDKKEETKENVINIEIS